MRSNSISATGSRCSPRGLTPQRRRSRHSLHHLHSTLNINKSFAMSTFRTQHAPSVQNLIYLHEASKEGCRFFCIKANFICNIFDKSSFRQNMFHNECNISHQCGCPRQLTYSIGFRFQGKEERRER